MLMKFLDKYKKGLTVLMGVAIFVVTLISLYNGIITWVYEGLAGVSVSILLVWLPNEIAKLILAIIKKITNKLLSTPKEEDLS
jgi:hypothetical protein